MGGIIGIAIGLVLATAGFLLMRNPMRFSYLAPMDTAAYQRAVLDTLSRNSLRVLGVLIFLFGAVVLTSATGGVLKLSSLSRISEGLTALLWFVFIGCFVGGIVQALVATVKGKDLFDWFRIGKEAADLGLISVFPEVTPKMEQETQVFTLTLIGVLALVIASGLLKP